MDAQLVKLFKHMELLSRLDKDDYSEGLSHGVERIIQNVYKSLGPAEKQWVDSHLDVEAFYDWKRVDDDVRNALHAAMETYKGSYTPTTALKDLFVWLDELLTASTYDQLTYGTEYLFWNIARCRECLTDEETRWVNARFSVDTLVRVGGAHSADAIAMYEAWQ